MLKVLFMLNDLTEGFEINRFFHKNLFSVDMKAR